LIMEKETASMLSKSKIHHVAIICSDYEKSKKFYTETLGFGIIQEVFREERKSYKLDLQVGDHSQIELFSFPSPPPRVSGPEACGLRHLAFTVEDVAEVLANLREAGVEAEDIRIDEYTGRKFTFFRDPDMLPLEIYEN
jgi:glyoxylase I family protein